MKEKLLILALIFSLGINIGIFGSIGYKRLKGKSEERHSREAEHSPMRFLAKELGLSESQTKEIEALRKSLEPKMEEIREELREKKAQLVYLLKESKPDLEKINIQLSEIESLQTKLQKLVIRHLLQEKNILTPEQQDKFFSIISKRLFHGERHQEEGLLPGTKEGKYECKDE